MYQDHGRENNQRASHSRGIADEQRGDRPEGRILLKTKGENILVPQGDWNTKVFHYSVTYYLHNRMDALLDNQGLRQDTTPGMHTIANNFINTLFIADPNLSPTHQQEILHNIPTLVSKNQNEILLKTITIKEVK